MGVRQNVGRFFKSLREELGGEPFPYLWVPEWHPGGHGLHAHFAVGRYIKRSLIEESWGHGFVHIKLLGDLPVGSGSLEEARLAARYLGKYAAKALESGACPVAPIRGRAGFNRGRSVAADTGARRSGRPRPDGVIAAVLRWHSSDLEGWQGPPACWVALGWAG